MPGGPYFNAKDNIDLFVNGLIVNEKVGAAAMDQLEKCKDKRFFIFVQFIQPDKNGHKFGENSLEYSDGIKSDDFWTGKIIDKLKELKIYDKTLVYVTADHGFDIGKKSHSYAPYVFLATNDKKVNRNGTREDVAPTVLKRFGMDLSKIEPRLDGIPLDEPAPERKAPAITRIRASVLEEPRPTRAACVEIDNCRPKRDEHLSAMLAQAVISEILTTPERRAQVFELFDVIACGLLDLTSATSNGPRPRCCW